MPEMNLKEVMKLYAAAQKRPDNLISLRLPVTILTVRPWPVKEGEEKMYTYKAFAAEHAAVLEFSSPKLYTASKPAEVVLTLMGFKAFERVR